MEVYNEAVFDLLVPPSEGHEKLQIVKKGKETVVQVSCTTDGNAPRIVETSSLWAA